jgi:hypothetical protein
MKSTFLLNMIEVQYDTNNFEQFQTKSDGLSTLTNILIEVWQFTEF